MLFTYALKTFAQANNRFAILIWNLLASNFVQTLLWNRGWMLCFGMFQKTTWIAEVKISNEENYDSLFV